MERRIEQRNLFSAQFEFDLSAHDSAGPVTGTARGFDIGSHGVGILTEHLLTPVMVIRLRLPAVAAGTMLPAFAEVAWIAPAAEEGMRAGLRFLE